MQSAKGPQGPVWYSFELKLGRKKLNLPSFVKFNLPAEPGLNNVIDDF